jgi:integrase
MARRVRILNALAVARAARRGYYADGGGLYLQVSASGAKSWVYRYRSLGRLHEMGLGSAGAVSLAQARVAAAQCHHLRAQGRDPLSERREKRRTMQLEAALAVSFQVCADSYIAAHEAGWRNRKHVEQWSSTLRIYVAPVFGAVPVREIDTNLVMRALTPIWNDKPETASRIRGRIEAVLDWAKVRGYRDSENPARWKGHLDQLLPARSRVRRIRHHAALPHNEMATFMSSLRKQPGTAAAALEFAILTAARTSEVLGAEWHEIDLRSDTWVIPARRMKSGTEHRVPLSAHALNILARMETARQSDFVFPGGFAKRSLSNMALLAVLRRMSTTNVTAHGFRSSFRDWAAEKTDFGREVAEMALAHTISDRVEAAYRRGDLFEKRVLLMRQWADHCSGATQNLERATSTDERFRLVTPR